MIIVRLAMTDGYEFDYKITSDPTLSLGVRKEGEVAGLKGFLELLDQDKLIQVSGDKVDRLLYTQGFEDAFFINPRHVRTVNAVFTANEEGR